MAIPTDSEDERTVDFILRDIEDVEELLEMMEELVDVRILMINPRF